MTINRIERRAVTVASVLSFCVRTLRQGRPIRDTADVIIDALGPIIGQPMSDADWERIRDSLIPQLRYRQRIASMQRRDLDTLTCRMAIQACYSLCLADPEHRGRSVHVLDRTQSPAVKVYVRKVG